MRHTSFTHVLCALALPLSLSLTACGDERRPANDTEKDLVVAVLETGLHLHDTNSNERITLPPGTETLIGLVVDAVCSAKVSTVTVGDHVKETLVFDCKDGDFKGNFSRELDHYSFDLFARTSLDVTYTGDVTARKDFVDGFAELKAIKDLWITDIGVSDRIDFLGIQRDASGCMIGGAMKMELHANIPGKKVDVSMDALFGPTCGEVWVRK